MLRSHNKPSAINIGRYYFYQESPNEYSFTGGDLGLSTSKPNFEMYDFYYNLEELQEPFKMDDDTISNLQSPASQKWSFFLQDSPTQGDEDMSTACPDLIAYTTDLEAELDCTLCNMQLWGEINTPLWYLTILIT
jgi:hypothetical protein